MVCRLAAIATKRNAIRSRCISEASAGARCGPPLMQVFRLASLPFNVLTRQMLQPSFTQGFMVHDKVAVWLSQEEDGRGASTTIYRLQKTLKHWGQVSYNSIFGAFGNHLKATRCERQKRPQRCLIFLVRRLALQTGVHEILPPCLAYDHVGLMLLLLVSCYVYWSHATTCICIRSLLPSYCAGDKT